MRSGLIRFVVCLLFASASAAHAQRSEISVAQQYGIAYLPLMVMQEHSLIEKQAKLDGLDIKVKWSRFAGGGAMNDALLSSSVDVAVGGVPSLILMWDKARGAFEVKGISALNTSPLFLNIRNPAVKSIKDLSAKDRIAITSAKTSSQAIVLQMAAARQWGPENFAKLDPLTVTMRHPDAMALLLANTGDVTGHFTSPPFQYQELRHDGVRTILSSKDVIGDATFIVTYTTRKFFAENAKVYAAFLRATDEAIAQIAADKKAAVAIYGRLAKVKDEDLALLAAILDEPDFKFGTTPEGILKYAEFMHQVGIIKNKPASWKQLFFDSVHSLNGS